MQFDINYQKNYTADFSIDDCRTAIRLDLFWQGVIKNEVNENCFEFKNLSLDKGLFFTRLGQYVVINLQPESESKTIVQIHTSPFSNIESSTSVWQSQMEELTGIVWGCLFRALYARSGTQNKDLQTSNGSIIDVQQSQNNNTVNTTAAAIEVKPNECNTTSNKARAFYMQHKKAIWIGSAIVIAVIILIVILTNLDSSGGVTIGKDNKAISAAKQLISEDLKDPSSVSWNEVKVIDKDNYDRFIIYVDYSAKNSFGGVVRSKYYVPVRLGDDNNFYYTYWRYYDISTFSVDFVKSNIHWNEAPKDDSI